MQSKQSPQSSALIDMQPLYLRTMKSTLVKAAERHSVTRRGHLKSWNQHQWAQSNPTPTSFLLLYNWFILDATVIRSNPQQTAPFSSHCPHLNWDTSNLTGADHSLFLYNFLTWCEVFFLSCLSSLLPLHLHSTIGDSGVRVWAILRPPKRILVRTQAWVRPSKDSVRWQSVICVIQLVLCGNVGNYRQRLMLTIWSHSPLRQVCGGCAQSGSGCGVKCVCFPCRQASWVLVQLSGQNAECA